MTKYFRGKALTTAELVSGEGVLSNGAFATIYKTNTEGSALDRAYIHYNVDASTIECSIDWPDANGQTIFEGDICSVDIVNEHAQKVDADEPIITTEIFKVAWSSSELCYIADFIDHIEPLSKFVDLEKQQLNVTVISNIHKNDRLAHDFYGGTY